MCRTAAVTDTCGVGLLTVTLSDDLWPPNEVPEGIHECCVCLYQKLHLSSEFAHNWCDGWFFLYIYFLYSRILLLGKICVKHKAECGGSRKNENICHWLTPLQLKPKTPVCTGWKNKTPSNKTNRFYISAEKRNPDIRESDLFQNESFILLCALWTTEVPLPVKEKRKKWWIGPRSRKNVPSIEKLFENVSVLFCSNCFGNKLFLITRTRGKWTWIVRHTGSFTCSYMPRSTWPHGHRLIPVISLIPRRAALCPAALFATDDSFWSNGDVPVEETTILPQFDSGPIHNVPLKYARLLRTL